MNGGRQGQAVYGGSSNNASTTAQQPRLTNLSIAKPWFISALGIGSSINTKEVS